MMNQLGPTGPGPSGLGGGFNGRGVNSYGLTGIGNSFTSPSAIGMSPIDRQYNDYGGGQQIVLLRSPTRTQSGAFGGALDGLDIDYDSYILLMGLALAAGAYALYQIILTKGRRRSFHTGQSWWQFALDRLNDFVWTGKSSFTSTL